MVDLKSELFKQLKDEGIRKVPNVSKDCKALLMKKGGTQIWMKASSLQHCITLIRIVETTNGLTIHEYTNIFDINDLRQALV